MTKKKQTEWRLGALSPGKREGAKHYVPPPLNLPSDRITNAGSVGLYTGERWHTRVGSEAHKQWPSLGGC